MEIIIKNIISLKPGFWKILVYESTQNRILLFLPTLIILFITLLFIFLAPFFIGIISVSFLNRFFPSIIAIYLIYQIKLLIDFYKKVTVIFVAEKSNKILFCKRSGKKIELDLNDFKIVYTETKSTTKFTLVNNAFGVYSFSLENNSLNKNFIDFLKLNEKVFNIADTEIGRKFNITKITNLPSEKEEEILNRLKMLIDFEKKRSIFSTSKSNLIIELINENYPTEAQLLNLIEFYEYNFSTQLIEELKKCSSNLSLVKELLQPFINAKIVSSEFPHNRLIDLNSKKIK